MLDPRFDAEYAEKYGVVCGTDEAGRGPLAGPVLAAAVILPTGDKLNKLLEAGLDDSKKITEKRRERLYDLIIENSLAYGIASSTHEEIDEINILAASLLAMRRSVDIVRDQIKPDVVLVDGNKTTDFGVPAFPIVHGDANSPSIAAASVLAKVTRDRMMIEMHDVYPEYGFAKHKGYPTKDHREAVKKYGPCPIHRVSFLSFLKRESK